MFGPSPSFLPLMDHTAFVVDICCDSWLVQNACIGTWLITCKCFKMNDDEKNVPVTDGTNQGPC